MGEFAVRENEIDAVTRIMRSVNIVTALHNHFTAEEPRLFYLHTFGVGNAEAIAKAAKQALDQMNVK